MKALILITTLIFSPLTFAETGMEKGTQTEETNYLYAPLNHLQTNFTVGATFFNLKGDSEDTDAKAGIKLGVNAELGQGMVYLIGLNYMNLKSELDVGNTTLEYQLDYLSLALGGKYYFSGANSGLFMRGNLNPSLLINDSVPSGTKGFDDFDVLAQLGLGYNIPGATNFTIDIDYTLGLLDINKEDNAGSIKNRGFTVSLGLLF